jgi:hypothetical protein
MLKRGDNERVQPRGYDGRSGRVDMARKRVTPAIRRQGRGSERGSGLARRCKGMGGRNICPFSCNLFVDFLIFGLGLSPRYAYRAVGDLLWVEGAWENGWVSLFRGGGACSLSGKLGLANLKANGKGERLLKAKGRAEKILLPYPEITLFTQKLPHKNHGSTGTRS